MLHFLHECYKNIAILITLKNNIYCHLSSAYYALAVKEKLAPDKMSKEKLTLSWYCCQFREEIADQFWKLRSIEKGWAFLRAGVRGKELQDLCLLNGFTRKKKFLWSSDKSLFNNLSKKPSEIGRQSFRTRGTIFLEEKHSPGLLNLQEAFKKDISKGRARIYHNWFSKVNVVRQGRSVA